MFAPKKIRSKRWPLGKVPKKLKVKPTTGDAKLVRPKRKPCGCGG